MPRDLENPLQRSIIAYLRLVIPERPIIAHVANEIGLSGQSVARQIAKQITNGMLPGFPDLVCVCHAGVFFLEVKAPSGRVGKSQAIVHADLARFGQRIAVVRSIEDVQAALDGWGIWRKDRRNT